MISEIIDFKFADCQQPIHLHKLPYTQKKTRQQKIERKKRFGGEIEHINKSKTDNLGEI